MTDDELIMRLRNVADVTDEQIIVQAADLIESQAKEIARLSALEELVCKHCGDNDRVPPERP